MTTIGVYISQDKSDRCDNF